ncbi:hypothetical protein Nepgr_033372 [Nepenthes gracilis]|uniref:Uncharacterized protein n=1 Tax=Nepenthes gracilis TaxID=150966 RepID=A0AAD3Y8L8_NEPGR|nr:hypothetical protein Nepgr_033372 [Nepenthes gracilis]
MGRRRCEALMLPSRSPPVLKHLVIQDTGSDLIWTRCEPRSALVNLRSFLTHKNRLPSLPCLAGDSMVKIFRAHHAIKASNIHMERRRFHNRRVMGIETFTFRPSTELNVVFGCGEDNQGFR